MHGQATYIMDASHNLMFCNNKASLSVMQDAIEECRKLCGGHGYLNSSGLPELFAVYVPACTYEGDNVVLLLQVSVVLHLIRFNLFFCTFGSVLASSVITTFGALCRLQGF